MFKVLLWKLSHRKDKLRGNLFPWAFYEYLLQQFCRPLGKTIFFLESGAKVKKSLLKYDFNLQTPKLDRLLTSHLPFKAFSSPSLPGSLPWPPPSLLQICSPGGLPYFSHSVAGHLSVAMSPLPQDYNSARLSIEHLAPCGQHAVGAYWVFTD